MCSKAILKLFYLPKVILKLHPEGKLQVTLVYCLYYKRDFSYYQTLYFENNYMLWSNHYLIFPLSGNWVATRFNFCGYNKFMKVICAFDKLENFVHVEIPL